MSFRSRLVVSVLISAVVVAGGTLMERRLGTRTLVAAAASEGVTGAWFCPHSGGEGWNAWVVAANPSAEPASLKLTTYSAGEEPQTMEATLEPGTHRYFDVSRTQPASASVAEFVGSPVAAGMVAARPQEGGLAAEPCASAAGPRWFVPEGSSLRGEESRIVVFNPFATDAVVDVALVAEDHIIRPGPLKGVVLGPGETRAFDLNRFALGEKPLTASVTAPLGRVAAAGFVASNGGLRSVVATAEPARTWMLPAAGDGAEGELIVLAPAGGDVPFRASAQGQESQVPVIDLESVPGGTAAAFDVNDPDAGLLVLAEGPAALVAGRRLSAAAPPPPPPQPTKERDRGARGGTGGNEKQQRGGPNGQRKDRGKPEPPEALPLDLASTGGVSAAAQAWVALPPVGPDGGPAALVLQNPTDGEAEAQITLLDETGQQGEPTRVTVPAGTEARVELPGTPVTAVVQALRGELVAAQVALGPTTFAVAVGSPLD